LLALACGDVDSVLPAPQPVVPREAAPTLTAVSPNVGSTVGATPVTLTGTGFESKSVSGVGRTEVVVTLGGNTVTGRVDHRDPRGTVIYLDTPAHAAGPVDVVVTTAHGGSVTLAGGYTYAAPDAFDFNGAWSGWDVVGIHLGVHFTVRDGALTSVACDSEAPLTFSDPPPVRDGAFSYASADGTVALSGRIVSASAAVGTIRLGACKSLPWSAGRR
jgi:hypothetical protein